jgi:hypothetical protein
MSVVCAVQFADRDRFNHRSARSQAHPSLADPRYHGPQKPGAEVALAANSLAGWRNRNNRGTSTAEPRRGGSLSRSIRGQFHQIPVNREINTEFCRIWPSVAIFVVYGRIPCRTEQGILQCVSGNFFEETGKFSVPAGQCLLPPFHDLSCGNR